MDSKQTNSPASAAYSVDQFCVAHGISRAMLYKLWTDGKGPRPMSVGSRKLISYEAAADWRRACEVDVV
jgi:predicted DNA-binding transcriptional regulator AlpA